MITRNIIAAQPHLFNDFTASLLVHLNLGANGYKVFQGRMPRTIDGCSVFTVIAFSTKGEVVGRGKMPLPATITSSDQKTEILAVIVFVVGQVVDGEMLKPSASQECAYSKAHNLLSGVRDRVPTS